MPTLQTRMHPGVMPIDTKIRARYQRGPHLMAGDLDGACGPLSLWTTLVVLKIATRPQVICQKFQFVNDKFEEAWKRCLGLWFEGTDDQEMDSLLDTVSPFVDRADCNGSMRKQVDFVIKHLRQNEVALLGLSRRDERDGHWTCAVGLEEIVTEKDRQVVGILCLDSSQPAPEMLRYNARLELHVPNRGATYVRYRGLAGDARTMTIDRSIAVWPRPLPKHVRQAASQREEVRASRQL